MLIVINLAKKISYFPSTWTETHWMKRKEINTNFPTNNIRQPLHDIADDLVYADLDENNYGPINYKAASIYNMVKFKGRTPNWGVVKLEVKHCFF